VIWLGFKEDISEPLLYRYFILNILNSQTQSLSLEGRGLLISY